MWIYSVLMTNECVSFSSALIKFLNQHHQNHHQIIISTIALVIISIIVIFVIVTIVIIKIIIRQGPPICPTRSNGIIKILIR